MRRQGRATRDGQGPRSPLATVLKWAGGVTAVLSFVFAVQQITQLVADTRERKRNTTELYRVGKLQQGAADYAAAWASFELGLKAAEPGGQLAKLTGQLGHERRQLREAQEDLAMEWLENLRVNVSRGETFTSVVASLAPAITRGITTATGARKADLLAHFGWANFLRWRDGQRELNPEQQYREALAVDPTNPYAHAYLGHWKAWTDRHEALPELRGHFAAALRAGRARVDVRAKQLAAIGDLGQEGEVDFLQLVTDMRSNNEPIDASTRSRLYGIYWSVCRPYGAGRAREPERFDALLGAVPIAEHLATFSGLFAGKSYDGSRAREREACRAALREGAGQREEALQAWVELRQGLSGDDAEWRRSADAAIARLSRRP